MVSVNEEWQLIKSNPAYAVSNLGQIKSLARTVMRSNGSKYRIQERLLRQAKTPRGYLFVSLYDVGNSRQRYVHQLVAEAFIGERHGGLEVNHKDGNKANNRASNLEYVSRQENMAHARCIGLIDIAGTKNPRVRYSPEQIRYAHSLVLKGMRHAEAALVSGVDQGTVESACAGKNWKCLGLEPVRRRTVHAPQS